MMLETGIQNLMDALGFGYLQYKPPAPSVIKSDRVKELSKKITGLTRTVAKRNQHGAEIKLHAAAAYREELDKIQSQIDAARSELDLAIKAAMNPSSTDGAQVTPDGENG
jgi:hypothetical protein